MTSRTKDYKWHGKAAEINDNLSSLQTRIKPVEPVQLGNNNYDNDVENDDDRLAREALGNKNAEKAKQNQETEIIRINALEKIEKDNRNKRDADEINKEKEKYKIVTNEKIMKELWVDINNILKDNFSIIPPELKIDEKPICFKIEKNTRMFEIVPRQKIEYYYYTLSNDVFEKKAENVCNNGNYKIENNVFINTFITKYGIETKTDEIEKKVKEKINEKLKFDSETYYTKKYADRTASLKRLQDSFNENKNIEKYLDLKIPITYFDTVSKTNRTFYETIELSDNEKEDWISFFKQNIDKILKEETEKLTKTLSEWDELKKKKIEFDIKQDISILRALQKNNIFKDIKKETGSGGKRTSNKVKSKKITRRRRTARKTHRRK